MIARGAARMIRQDRLPIFAGFVEVHPRLFSMGLVCALLLAGRGVTQADDTAAVQAPEHEAVSPPLGDDAVPEPPDWGMPRDAEMLPDAGGLVSRLRCDDCCPGCDECCPVSREDWGCLDEDLCCFASGYDGCDAVWGYNDASFYLGLEFGVLKPEVDRLRLPGTTNPTSIKPDHGFEFAPRFFAGFRACDGWGGQVSYWTLETGANRTNLPQVFHDLDLQTLDVDFTKTCEVGDWSIQVGAGGRWGQIDSHYFSIINPAQRLRADFDGTGPTALLNVRRPLGRGNWALVGEGRASFLYGNTSIDTPLAPNLQIGDDWVEIWEGRAGIEWNGPSASGDALFFVRALLEGQYWNVPGVGPAGSPDMNFLGPTVSVGFVF